MKYLLDTNTISELYDPEAPCNDCISAHVSALGEDDDLYISIIFEGSNNLNGSIVRENYANAIIGNLSSATNRK